MTAHLTPKTHTPGPALRFVAAALIVRDGEVLIGQRRADQPMASLWEFPGGKIEPGESAQEALARELVEELGHSRRSRSARSRAFAITIAEAAQLICNSSRCASFAGDIDNQIYQQVRWVKLEELTDYKFLAADRGLIQDLAAGKFF